MAKHDRIELKKIDEAIRDVALKLKAARAGASAAHRAHIDSLTRQLGGLQRQTKYICIRTFAVWPPEPGPDMPGPGKTGKKPSKPGKAKPQPKRKPSRPKKG